VDEKRTIAIGDQYTRGDTPNYVYSNRYRIGDYQSCGELYLKIKPDLILRGHSEPLWIEPGYIEALKAKGEMLDKLHEEILPSGDINLGTEGFCARIYPYQLNARRGEEVSLEVEIENPSMREEELELQLIVPDGWSVKERKVKIKLLSHATGTVVFIINIPCITAQRRVRVAVDVTVGATELGQQAEALITVV
jgi:hypothetical protein